MHLQRHGRKWVELFGSLRQLLATEWICAMHIPSLHDHDELALGVRCALLSRLDCRSANAPIHRRLISLAGLTSVVRSENERRSKIVLPINPALTIRRRRFRCIPLLSFRHEFFGWKAHYAQRLHRNLPLCSHSNTIRLLPPLQPVRVSDLPSALASPSNVFREPPVDLQRIPGAGWRQDGLFALWYYSSNHKTPAESSVIRTGHFCFGPRGCVFSVPLNKGIKGKPHLQRSPSTPVGRGPSC